MRKLIFAINITADGCVDHTKGMANDEVHKYFADLLRQTDVFVYGRKTYELMVPFWPDYAKNHSGAVDATSEFAHAFNEVKKIIVFSKTLQDPIDNKTIILHGNLKDEILNLKNESGKDIGLGGVDLPSQLMELDLIDEYHFMVQPLVVGEGRRLWEGVSLPGKLNLKLVDSKVFPSGFVALKYVRDSN